MSTMHIPQSGAMHTQGKACLEGLQVLVGNGMVKGGEVLADLDVQPLVLEAQPQHPVRGPLVHLRRLHCTHKPPRRGSPSANCSIVPFL